MNENHELIKKIIKSAEPWSGVCSPNWEGVANLILEDRRRICEPLVKYKDECKEPWGYPKSHLAIDQCLIKAGLEEK